VNFPELVFDEQYFAHASRRAGYLFPVTACKCGLVNYEHRLGCSCGLWCGGGAYWAYWHSGRVIMPGTDFCFLEDKPVEQVWIDIPKFLRRGDD
jgi:hypothetical protein